MYLGVFYEIPMLGFIRFTALSQNGLSSLESTNDVLFIRHQIDLATFLTLTDQDLRELGISTFGARRKMLLAIAGKYIIDSQHFLLKGQWFYFGTFILICERKES